MTIQLTGLHAAAFAGAVWVLLAVSHPILANEQPEAPLTVEPSIKTVVDLLEPSAPRYALHRVKFLMEMVSRANVQPSEIDSRYLAISDGLWGVMSTLQRSNGTGAQQVVTVCGIFDALSATTSTFTLDQNTVLPIGKIFVPFGMKTNFSTDSVARMVKLDVNPNVACRPAPNTSFDFSTQTETQYKTSPSVASSVKTISVSAKGRCSVSEKRSAASLSPNLRGEYLDVTCTSMNDTGKSLTRRFAYLSDSALYLLLETKSDANQFKYSVLSVEYDN
jgi:hypothetical protein